MKSVILLALVVAASASLGSIEFQSVMPNDPFWEGGAISVPDMATFNRAMRDFKNQVLTAHRNLLQTVKPVPVTDGSLAEIPTTQAISAGCMSAFQSLANLFLSGNCSFPDVEAATDVTLGQFCTSNCVTTVQSLTVQAKAACTVEDRAVFADVSFAANLRKAAVIINTVCFQDNGQYCWLHITRVASLARAAGSTLTKEILDNVCTPCARAIFTRLAEFGDGNVIVFAAAIDVVCYQKEGKYCILELSGATSPLSGNGPPDFNKICTPCFRVWFSKALQFAAVYQVATNQDPSTSFAALQNLQAVGVLLRAMCIRDEGGVFCGTRFVNFATQQAANPPTGPSPCPANLTTASTCPDTCKAQLGTLIGGFGCCFPTIFDALLASGIGSTDTGDSIALIKGFVTGKCGLNWGAPCSGVRIKAKLVLRNLLLAWVTASPANRALLEAKLKADLALHFELTNGDVDINAVGDAADPTVKPAGFLPGTQSQFHTQAAGDIAVYYTMNPADPDAAATIQTKVTSGTDVPLANTAQLPFDARADPFTGVTTDPAAASATTERAAAAGLTASFGVLLAAIAAVFVARAL